MKDLDGSAVARKWGHNELAADLASSLLSPTRMVWADMQLGPSGSPRPDVYTLEKSYSKPRPSAYEVKVSRADLRSDTTSGKWQSYLAFAGSVTFAVPDGLCTVADIPDKCGLIVRKGAVWRYARRPTIQHVTPPFDACMKLLMDGLSRAVGSRAPEPRSIALWREHEGVRKKFGEAVARAARDIAGAQQDAEQLIKMRHDGYRRVDAEVVVHRKLMMDRAKADMAEFERIKRELIEWLELDEDAAGYAVRRRIADMRAACDADARVAAAERKLGMAANSVRHALSMIEGAQ